MGQINDGMVAHISDLLAPWALVAARRMFNSWGLYRGALMFGLLSGEQLYLKYGLALSDIASGRELEFFTYEKIVPPKTRSGQATTKKVKLSYVSAPPDILEDSDTLIRWADAAWQDAIAGQRLKAAGTPHTPNGRPLRRRKA